MNQRARQLHATANRQVAGLIDLATRLDDDTASRPCPGREKLGDGTVAALVTHTADNYQRIAGFLDAAPQIPQAPSPRTKPRIGRLLQSLGHRIPDHAQHQPRDHHGADTAIDLDRQALTAQLSDTRASLRQLATLTDNRLDAAPPAGSFRFADGQRSLEQVLAGLLKHQAHQLDAIRSALG